MEKLTRKLKTINQALSTLKTGIELFQKHLSSNDEDISLSMQDSMIQRFEYCTDLFWKTIKIYMEDFEKIIIKYNTPKEIIRQATLARIISEEEGSKCIEMIKNRNETSHIYHREIADIIAGKIPEFYNLIHAIIDRVEKQVTKK